MKLVWEITYRAAGRRVTKHFEDVTTFNAAVKTFQGDELKVALKLQASAGEMLPAFLPRLLMPEVK